MDWVGRIKEFWLREKDERVYALVRISLAIVSIANIADLWKYRGSLFSDAGIFPMNADGDQFHYSLFYFLRSEEAITAFFIFGIVFAVCLGIGILPRIAALGVFVWTLSYSNHLSFISHGWDGVLRVYAFLILVSPLGACWTLSRIRGRNTAARMVPGYGILLMRLQLAVIYLDTAIAKFPSEFWKNGEAFGYYMMSVYSRWKLPLFADYEWLSKFCTYSTLVLELGLPFLLLIRRTRWVGVVMGVGLHVLIAITSVNLLLFSLAMIPAYLSFFDRESLDRVTEIVSRLCGTKEKAASSEAALE